MLIGLTHLLLATLLAETCSASIPLVVNTWNFPSATRKAWKVLTDISLGNDNALDALTFGCNACERAECGSTVGYGGNPDENGETTLDAMVFDGDTMDMGAVGGLRRIKDAILVARRVLDDTEHSLLVGDLATEVARMLGSTPEALHTDDSLQVWEEWKNENCTPNFWKNMPGFPTLCAPYSVHLHTTGESSYSSNPSEDTDRAVGEDNHDSIGMIVISDVGHVVAGTSSNGLAHKIPGRVGDSPIPGAGAYADSEYGAAVSTGNGDIMMRFLPSFLAVEQLRAGSSPTRAAEVAVSRIAEKYPTFFGAVIVADNKGDVGVACNGMSEFSFMVANDEYPEGDLRFVDCTTGGSGTGDTLTSGSVRVYASVIMLLVYWF